MASKTTKALGQARQWGRVEVFPSAVAAIAGHAALGCYGIAGMAARGLRDGMAELLHRGNVDRGVDVAEVIIGIARADPESYLTIAPSWRPTLPPHQPGSFKIRDLLVPAP